MSALSLRALNRTLLRRQLLDARADVPVADAVARLLAVQAQEPNWVFAALWSRVAGLTRADVEAAVEARALVRGPLLRGTQHLVTADDYRWLRPTVAPVLDRLSRAPYYRDQTGGIDPAELVALARDVLGDDLVPRRDLGAALAARWPGRRAAVLAAAVESLTPVVHGPATSAFGSWWSRRSIRVADAAAWLGAPMRDPDLPALVRRYLAAFGPASVMDLQAFTGLTRLRPVVEDLRDGLRTYRGPDGAELLDVVDGALVDEDAPVPVRLLGAFDDAVLGHRDRTRVLPEPFRTTVMPGYSMVHATVLVDGFVAATWTVDDGALAVHPLAPLPPGAEDDVLAEAARMAAFLDLDPAVTITR
ncbi:winged helix DNA-binding domain-containing protein [Cellulosimicrobium cellulans]|uniref:winged helix DNA-binding domain-containing protein n=1 Tax=Cellulosimicrobium cellulans TaxID=1710 RepID=UPI00130EABE9|nr:winged helix DNA-binding domain-containing protein [Cellulosimicrobium cellulans]